MSSRPDVVQAIAHLQAMLPETNSPEALVAALRALFERYGDVAPRPPPEGMRVEPVDAGGVAAEWIIPADAAKDLRIVHFHGGGLAAGSRTSHRPMLAALAQHAGAPALSVDYRLGPEHVFPAAHEDCVRAFAWAAHGAKSIVASGDSIGCALAAAVCAEALATGGRAPDKLALLSPTLECVAYPERPDRDSDPLLNNAGMGMLGFHAREAEFQDPRMSPLRMADEALARFPPTLLQAGSTEFLLPDAERFFERLTRAHRRATLSIWPDMPHVWHHFLNHLPEADAALREAAAFIRAD
ncbi:MAG: alpha/beta hydrolase fold domain-containing protein [Hyphomonadaceae bacterium]|nr:alpha/beta hydrolase fold domain-containing protein [Hyphomonadaceae bacterium]